MQILIVDDQHAIRDALQMLFEAHGLDAVSADGPEQALAAIRSEDIGIVIQDMNFAEGETAGRAGVALFQAIRKLDPELAPAVVRAFASYFHVINTLEQEHRLRSLRARSLATPDEPLRESIGEAMATVPDDMPAEEVQRFLTFLRENSGQVSAEDMTVEDIAQLDSQMAKLLQIKQEIELRIEQLKHSGVGENTPQLKSAAELLKVREKMISGSGPAV